VNFKLVAILTIFSLLIIPKVNSQYFIGFKMGFNTNWRILTEHKSDLYKTYRRSDESVTFGSEFQINYYFPSKSKIRFSTGLGYSQFGYQYVDYLTDPCYYFVTCGYSYEIHRYSFSYLRIPFKITQISKDKHFIFEPGFSLLIPLSSKYQWLLREDRYDFSSQAITTEYDLIKMDQLQFSFDLNLGYSINMSSNAMLRIFAETSFVLNNYENEHVKKWIYNIGRFSGHDKSTKEHLIRFGLTVEFLFSLS